MRTVPASFGPEMQEVYSKSTWLVRIITKAVEANGYAPATLLLSSGGQVTYDTDTYIAGGLIVEGTVSQDEVRFSLPNEQGQILSMASTGELHRATVDIHVMYPDTTDAVQFMQGYISNVSGLFRDRAQLSANRYADANSVVPTMLIAPPNWTKLPPIDLVIEWAGQRITLEA